MNLSNAELLMIVVSPFFVITATATIRKYIPKLDGPWVVMFVFVLSEIICVAERFLTKPEQWLYGVIAGLLLTVVSLGANEKGNQLVERFIKKKPDDAAKAGPS